ncbi:Alpha/Beta hydrolase protein [Podospora australis]|uniref:Alpha/Beta hydrolase protein n=1 Tax=Podospora australis TaxID=1536484 RepID=A0AAN6X3G0_9PEZI|nr:Alpha/Beta hydrolase protein [Podospora australis]
MPPRIPTPSDFSHLTSSLPHQLIFPSPPESTQAILLLFHGLGDSETPFASFARNLNLPGVLAIAVRGINPLPPSLLPESAQTFGPPRHFHWGDDLQLSQAEEILDPDPGFTKATRGIMTELVEGVLIGRCGWELSDILLFGFGQGGSLALGLASQLRVEPRVTDVTDSDSKEKRKQFKGVVSIGGALPVSTIPTVSSRKKAATPVLVLCGRESETVDDDAEDLLQEEFEKVKVVRWQTRQDDGMPRCREEVLPMMEFFGERLRGGQGGGWR